MSTAGLTHYQGKNYAWAIDGRAADNVAVTPLNPCSDEELIHAAIAIENELEQKHKQCFYAVYVFAQDFAPKTATEAGV